MTQTQIKKRIAKMKAEVKISWTEPNKNVCPNCGETFRCVCNLKKHIKTCWDYKTKDEK